MLHIICTACLYQWVTTHKNSNFALQLSTVIHTTTAILYHTTYSNVYHGDSQPICIEMPQASRLYYCTHIQQRASSLHSHTHTKSTHSHTQPHTVKSPLPVSPTQNTANVDSLTHKRRKWTDSHNTQGVYIIQGTLCARPAYYRLCPGPQRLLGTVLRLSVT